MASGVPVPAAIWSQPGLSSPTTPTNMSAGEAKPSVPGESQPTDGRVKMYLSNVHVLSPVSLMLICVPTLIWLQTLNLLILRLTDLLD